MRSLSSLILLCLLAAHVGAESLKGTELLYSCQKFELGATTYDASQAYLLGQCTGYIKGVIESGIRGECEAITVNEGLVILVVKKYLNENPEALDKQAVDLITTAINKSWPCKSPKQKS